MTRHYLTTVFKFSSLALLLNVTGCAEYHRRQLESTPERGPVFTRALAKEYGVLGTVEENDMYDCWSANYFFRKAICAKRGHCVGPAILSQWDLPPEKVPELEQARCRLMGALLSGGRRLAPRLMARAQSHFDCWVEQQEENWQYGDINRCKSVFYATIAEIELILKGGVPQVRPTAEVFFNLNSARLNLQSLEIIDSLVKGNKGRHFLLIGRTDPSGERKHNKILAERRALEVKRELVRRGVLPCMVTLKAGDPLPGPRIDIHERRVDIIVLK